MSHKLRLVEHSSISVITKYCSVLYHFNEQKYIFKIFQVVTTRKYMLYTTISLHVLCSAETVYVDVFHGVNGVDAKWGLKITYTKTVYISSLIIYVSSNNVFNAENIYTFYNLG